MNDGIIQKVFTKHRNKLNEHKHNYGMGSMQDIFNSELRRINIIEQELIEEIKKASESSINTTPHGLKIIKVIRLSTLIIGDNQRMATVHESETIEHVITYYSEPLANISYELAMFYRSLE